MRRIFITGGTGFFGKSMLDYRLRHPDWEWAQAEWIILSRSPERFVAVHPQLANQPGVSFAAGDVRDFAFSQGPFDAIIHAATSAVTTLSDAEMTSVILDGARHVADFAKAAGCRTILFTSSGAVYGPGTTPASESDACNPATAYGKGKLAASTLPSATSSRIAWMASLSSSTAMARRFAATFMPMTSLNGSLQFSSEVRQGGPTTWDRQKRSPSAPWRRRCGRRWGRTMKSRCWACQQEKLRLCMCQRLGVPGRSWGSWRAFR